MYIMKKLIQFAFGLEKDQSWKAKKILMRKTLISNSDLGAMYSSSLMSWNFHVWIGNCVQHALEHVCSFGGCSFANCVH